MKKFTCLVVIAFTILTELPAQSWQLQQHRPNLEMADLHFINNSSGFVFGDSAISGTFITGIVLSTNDGGANWTTHSLGNSNYSTTKACVLNSNEIFSAGRNGGGNNGLFIKSVDGGATWINPATFNEKLFNVCFINSSTGWVLGKNGLLSKTTDGGMTWVSQNVSGEDMLSMKFYDAYTGLLGCGGGELYRTNDAGNSWLSVNSNVPDGLLSIATVGQEAWICGEAGTIIYSGDYGQTWTVQTSTLPVDYSAVSFANNTTGWMVGMAGTINATSSAGGTWQGQTCSTTSDIVGLSVTDINHGWFCTVDGEIFKFDNTTSIEENPTTSVSMSIYPNPTSGILNLISHVEENREGIIIDAMGRIVKRFELNGNTTRQLNISDFTSGLYTVYMEGKNQTTVKSVLRFVKEQANK